MALNESQPSFPDPTDIECLKKALGLPSICLATTVNEVQCGTPLCRKEKVDPILSSLLKPFDTTTIPGSCTGHTDQLLFRLLWVPLCPSRSQHSAPSNNILSLNTIRDRFQKWKLSKENDKANDEAPTAGVDGCHESQTSALGEGFQRDTVHDAAFDIEKDNEHDEEDEDTDEDDASSHSEEQPSEYQPSEYQPSEYQSDEYQPSGQQNDKHSEGRTNNALDGKPTEVPKNKLCESLDEQLRQSKETLLHATDDQGPTSLATPPRTTNNSSKSESGSKDEPDSRSEASTPVPIIFSPSEPSFADTPDTEKTTSPTDWQDKDDYFDSPSLNRGPSARSGEVLSIPPPIMSSLLQPKTPESHNEERPTTPFNSKNLESAGRNSTQRGRSVSTKKKTPRTPLHPSRTLADGTKTAEIWEISAKSNALRDILDTMRTIAKGDHGVPGHVYAYKHRSVPGHIKIGFAKDKGDSSEKSHVVLHPVGEHKDLHLWKRLKDQEFKCMSDMEVLFAVYMPCAAGQMERLVHHTLHEEKRIAHCQNSVCGRRHNEWFVVDKERAFEVISRWAEFSRLFPYDKIGSLGVSWHDHAHNYSKLSSSMTLEEWWNGPWSDFIEAQEIQHDQQLAAALEEKRINQQEETSLLDAQLKIQLERNRLQQEKNELEQCATRLREEKVKRDLDRTRDRQQELQEQIERLSLR